MENKKHWLIGVIAALVADIIFNFAYGLSIGGERHFLYYLINTIVVLVTLGFVFKFNFKDKTDIGLFIIILIVCVGINGAMYNKANEMFADDSSATTYTAKVEDYSYPSRGDGDATVFFTNPQGEYACAYAEYDYEFDFEFNDVEINVTEKMGAFKYKCYQVNDIYIK